NRRGSAAIVIWPGLSHAVFMCMGQPGRCFSMGFCGPLSPVARSERERLPKRSKDSASAMGADDPEPTASRRLDNELVVCLHGGRTDVRQVFPAAVGPQHIVAARLAIVPAGQG